MSGYVRFMIGAAIFNGLVIGTGLVATVVHGDAFAAAVLGVTLGVWVSIVMVRVYAYRRTRERWEFE